MEEIELRELIEILIKRKKIIALITVAAMLISVIFSFVIIKPTYEAKMVMMTSNLGNQAGRNGDMDIAKVDDLLNIMSQYPDMNLETYREQIKSHEVLQKTIKDLQLEGEYTADSLGPKIILDTVKDTQLITVKMIHADSEKAASIVNKLGENFVSFVTEKAQERSAKTSEYIKTQMEVEKGKYEGTLLELKQILSEPRGAQELESELGSNFKQITQFKSNLNELEIKKDGLNGAIEESGKSSTNRGSMIIKPNLGENFNISFDDSNKVMKIDLAETEGRMTSIEKQIGELQKHIEEIQIEYQDKKYKEDIVRQKVNIAQKTYESFVGKFEELKVSETAKIGELSINIISSAYRTTKPIGPRKALNLAISLVLGLMIGVFYAFFKEYWESGSNNDDKINGGEVIEGH